MPTRRTQNRLSQAAFINSRGTEMLPCSACAKSKVACVVLDSKSRRCGECVRRGFSRCDVSGIPAGSLDALMKEEEKLKLEREAAFKVAVESMARVDRLQKQLALVQEKADKLSSRVMAELDVEDGVTPDAPLDSSVVEPSAVDFPSPGNPFWDFFSETVVGESSHSVGFLLVPMYHLFRCILSI